MNDILVKNFYFLQDLENYNFKKGISYLKTLNKRVPNAVTINDLNLSGIRWDIYYDFIKDNNFTELKEAELMNQRLGLLGAVDPYTGRYFSQAWIQRNVLRLTDDQIAEMQKEIDQEKEEGLGLPVGVMNDVAQQQMMSAVPAQPTHPEDLKAQAAMQQDAIKAKAKKEEVNTFTKLKRIL